MKRALLVIPFLSLGSLPAVDFTPMLTVKKVERFSIPVLTFAAVEDRISYKPPFKWQSAGSPEALTLRPPAPSTGTMKLLSLRWSPERTAKLGTAESEQKWALEFLPTEADEPEVTGKFESPFTLGPYTSPESIISYQIDGVPQKISVSRCDISAVERIVVLISSEAESFETFRQDGMSSLFSWEWLGASSQMAAAIASPISRVPTR